MISKTDLAPVTEFKSTPGRVLSVYLDVDQAHVENLNRQFELAFESAIKEAVKPFEEDYEERDFAGCLDEVRKILRAYEPRARGLVIFARSSGSIWMRELNVPVKTQVFWGTSPHVQQFLEALGECEKYALVLTDRCRSRIFTVKMGELEKHAEIYALRTVRHFKTTGTDHLYSQSHMRRRADEHALAHLKRVVELLEHVSNVTPFDGLILAGGGDATGQVFRLLPKSFRKKVVASVSLPANAPDSRILEEVMFIGRKAERVHELETTEVLITASAKGKHSVTGLYATLAALNANRVRDLVYTAGVAFLGGVCEACDALFSSDLVNCDFCGLPVKPHDDLIEAIIAKSLAQGADIEQVRGDAAEKLDAVGSIGAFLRY